ncbi:MAG: hypothetical protein WAO35_06885 [Terriglobia bacterium]
MIYEPLIPNPILGSALLRRRIKCGISNGCQEGWWRRQQQNTRFLRYGRTAPIIEEWNADGSLGERRSYRRAARGRLAMWHGDPARTGQGQNDDAMRLVTEAPSGIIP